MNISRILLVVAGFSLASSFAFAGPGAQFYQHRRVERARPAAVTVVGVQKPATSCCRVTTVERPIASHKLSLRTKKVECSGCATMAAGQKCPAS